MYKRAVIGDEVFHVHGGLGEGKSLTLDYTRSIDHRAITAPNAATEVVKEQVFSLEVPLRIEGGGGDGTSR